MEAVTGMDRGYKPPRLMGAALLRPVRSALDYLPQIRYNLVAVARLVPSYGRHQRMDESERTPNELFPSSPVEGLQCGIYGFVCCFD